MTLTDKYGELHRLTRVVHDTTYRLDDGRLGDDIAPAVIASDTALKKAYPRVRADSSTANRKPSK